jgi:DNA-binding MarR family transcriptional regulator
MSDSATDWPWHEVVAIPALLRHARTVYGNAMRAALADAGCDDIPKNGLYVVGGLARGAAGVTLGRLAEELGVSKQAAGQLVDSLVLRGYLIRTVDADDRRKISVALSKRGQMAAEVQAAAREYVDAALAMKVGTECVSQMRKALGALCAMSRKEMDHEQNH